MQLEIEACFMEAKWDAWSSDTRVTKILNKFTK